MHILIDIPKDQGLLTFHINPVVHAANLRNNQDHPNLISSNLIRRHAIMLSSSLRLGLQRLTYITPTIFHLTGTHLDSGGFNGSLEFFNPVHSIFFSMADALCGPSNALQSFKNHSQVDRTLQQDRFTDTRHSQAQVCPLLY